MAGRRFGNLFGLSVVVKTTTMRKMGSKLLSCVERTHITTTKNSSPSNVVYKQGDVQMTVTSDN